MGQLELPFKGRVVLNNFEVANEFFAFDVNTVGDPYGSKFWQKISDLKYEPDTLFFLLSNLEKNDTFIDVGAANGAMTLIAATRCQTVLAFEPEFEIFSCLARNVELNENLVSKIKLHNIELETSFEIDSAPDILSKIVFTGKELKSQNLVSIKDIKEVVNVAKSHTQGKIVMKMDIEGAEWRILNDPIVVTCFRENRVLLLLAVHPGFHRPFKKKIRGIDYLSHLVWKRKNRSESGETFKRLQGFARIFRLNMNEVTQEKEFTKFIENGYHEFIVDFR